MDPVSAVSLVSMGLGAAGSLTQANGQSAASRHAAQGAVYAAQTARINANSTDAYYRDDLRRTLANISAVRASAGVTPDSPTGVAIGEEQARVSDNQRMAKVVGLRAQANQDDADAKFYEGAASQYQTMGLINAGAGVTGGLAKTSWVKNAW